MSSPPKAKAIARSARPSGDSAGMAVTAETIVVAALFAGFGSFALDTVAVFVNAPPVAGSVATIVIVADADGATVPTLQTTVVVPVHVPCVDDADVRVIPGGSMSVTVTESALNEPTFVATIVNVTLWPAAWDGASALLVMDMSADGGSTAVFVVSDEVPLTVAVFRSGLGAVGETCSRSRNDVVPGTIDAVVHVTVPPEPTAGVVQANAGPLCSIDTNVVPVGSGSVRVTFGAFDGPAFLTWIE